MHVKAVPRVGGIGIVAGSAAAPRGGLDRGGLQRDLLLMLACMVPAFGSGIWEDFTKAISPRRRMLALALSGLLGVLLLGGRFTHTGWEPSTSCSPRTVCCGWARSGPSSRSPVSPTRSTSSTA